MTAPQHPQEHCGHECVCMGYRLAEGIDEGDLCPGTDEEDSKCPHDTRTHSSPAAAPVPESNPLALENLTVSAVCAYEVGVKDGALAERVRATRGRKVITLCGSVKFWDEYREWNARLTLEGNIVFSCGLSMKEGYEDILCDLPLNDVKANLDQIHLCKINLSDEIFVLNVGGYIGESTRREIEYALLKGKRVRYLESLRREGEQHG